MEFASPTSAYVHVPFCLHKCGYCDFTVIAGRDDLIGPYLDCLESDLRGELQEPQPMQTVFIGGGTPSLLPAADLQKLFGLLRDWLPLERGGEYSIECNPETLTADRIQSMRDAGINRVSLGVQSFQEDHLKLLERGHTAQTVSEAVRALQACGIDNVSLDLIFGIPGQSLADWQQALNQAIALNPCHISTYGLTFEKGTSFWTRREKNLLKQAPEELERSMYALAMELLPSRGYLQYELSNFSLPGRECRHNRVYWQGASYYGFGPGAAAYRDGVRTLNHRSVTTWIRRLQQGATGMQEQEAFDLDLRRREAVMLGLRQIQGIDRDVYREHFGISVRELSPQSYDSFLASGHLEESGPDIRLTLSGRFIADTVMSEFL